MSQIFKQCNRRVKLVCVLIEYLILNSNICRPIIFRAKILFLSQNYYFHCKNNIFIAKILFSLQKYYFHCKTIVFIAKILFSFQKYYFHCKILFSLQKYYFHGKNIIFIAKIIFLTKYICFVQAPRLRSLYRQLSAHHLLE